MVLGFGLLALAACGGSTVSVGDSSADGGGGGGGGGGGSSGGSACGAAGGPSCPRECTAQLTPDCKCGTPTCLDGTWECPRSCDDGDLDAGRADAAVDASATFPCGGLLVCHSAAEYCKVGVGGPPGAQPSYSCEPIPAACASNVTCACIQPAVGGQICTEPGVTVTFEYP